MHYKKCILRPNLEEEFTIVNKEIGKEIGNGKHKSNF